MDKCCYCKSETRFAFMEKCSDCSRLYTVCVKCRVQRCLGCSVACCVRRERKLTELAHKQKSDNKAALLSYW